MAAQYTEISLDEMETFLKRGFRALRPKQGIKSGEYYYDLNLSPNVAIRVWSSIQQGRAMGASVGTDAIRVQLMGVGSKRPLLTGSAPIVKRTQGWKNSLQNRLEEATEMYEERQGYFESRGGGTPEPSAEPPSSDRPAAATGNGPSDKQVKYLLFLASQISRGVWDSSLSSRFPGLSYPLTKDGLQKLTGRQASLLIDLLKSKGSGSSRYAQDDYTYDRS
jgi:hypothetical protein